MSTSQRKMKAARVLIGGVLAVFIAATAGCASALFFPAKPAEKAADKLIDDIWPVANKPVPAKPEAKKS